MNSKPNKPAITASKPSKSELAKRRTILSDDALLEIIPFKLRTPTWDEDVALMTHFHARYHYWHFIRRSGLIWCADIGNSVAWVVTDQLRNVADVHHFSGPPFCDSTGKRIKHLQIKITDDTIGGFYRPVGQLAEECIVYIALGGADLGAWAMRLCLSRPCQFLVRLTSAPLTKDELEVCAGRHVWLPRYPGLFAGWQKQLMAVHAITFPHELNGCSSLLGSLRKERRLQIKEKENQP